jgi:hypothetical protein
MSIRSSRQPRCGEHPNSAENSTERETENGDNSDISDKRINSKEARSAAQATARTE